MPEIQSWNNGDIILINAPTGSGKTRFIQNNLRGYCKTISKRNEKILLLSNRTLLKEQNQKDFEDDPYISFQNYQWLEKMIKEEAPIKYYDYIVADEAHYFFSDSDFNRSTDLTFNWLNNQSKSTVILLTATSSLVKKYYEEKLKLTLKKYDVSAAA